MNMEKIPSFKVNHNLLKEGIYVSRVDRVGDENVTTYDIRVFAPNTDPFLPEITNEPDIIGCAFHTIEHIGAAYFRSEDCSFHDDVIYFGPMGCLTGFYLIVKGKHEIKEIWSETFKMCCHIIACQNIPGCSEEECGRSYYHDIDKAQRIAKRFKSILEEGPTESRTVYPLGKVLILCAMKEEADIIKEGLFKDGVSSDSIPFTAVVEVVGIGKVNAAVNATKFIEKHNPNYVVSFGFAGGISNPGDVFVVKKGTFAIAEKVFYHDVWCGEPNAVGQVQGYPPYFECEKNNKIMNEIYVAVSNDRKNYPIGSLKIGSIATGDSFITSQKDVIRILGIDPRTICVDMEAAAVAQVCYDNNVPFLAYKLISDVIGEGDQMKEYFKSVERYG